MSVGVVKGAIKIWIVVSLVRGPRVMLLDGMVVGMSLAVAADTLTSEGESVKPFSFCALTLTLIGSKSW